MIKRIAYILCFSLMGGAFASCEDDLLTQVNPNALTDGSFWKTEADFDMAVNALYGSLQLEYVSGAGLSYEMLRSDLAGTETWYTVQNVFTQLKWNSSTRYVENRWSQLYVGIFRANQILHYIESANFLPQKKKEQIIAQARFIRGYNYFFLAYTYNGAVIHDKMATSAEEMHIPFSSKDEVITKMVIPDLQAAQSLPEVWPNGNDGHITWGAATAMLGKTYLFQKKWDEAEKCFSQIVEKAENEGLYGLVENYMDNFTTDNEFNKESIFEISFSDNFKPGNNGNNHDETDGSEAVSIASQLASIKAGGYNTVLPTYHCHEMFVSSDVMDPNAKWTKENHKNSMRTYATIVVEHGDGDYYKAPLVDTFDANGKLEVQNKVNFGYGQSSKVKKWTRWDRAESEDPTTGSRTGINYRAIRYADVLLMYAESILENSGNVEKATKYIDLVRERAGVIKLSDYKAANNGYFPKLWVSKFANNSNEFEMIPVNKENILMHLKMCERLLELAFEGHRWLDLVRWGLVGECFNQCWTEEKGLRVNLCGSESKTAITSEIIPPLYLRTRVRPDFEMRSTVYQSKVHDYLPIPSCEIQNNKALQNKK